MCLQQIEPTTSLLPLQVPALRQHVREIAAKARVALVKSLTAGLSHFVTSAGKALLNQVGVCCLVAFIGRRGWLTIQGCGVWLAWKLCVWEGGHACV